jgi:hypothetical protein
MRIDFKETNELLSITRHDIMALDAVYCQKSGEV